MILPWDYNVENAPRNYMTKVMIAVRGSLKVRFCQWDRHNKKWLGLMPGEIPLAFFVVSHPRKPVAMLPPGVMPGASLPPGMNVELTAHNMRAMRGDFD